MHNTTIETRTRTVVKQVNDEEVLLGQILDLYPAGIVSVVMDTSDLWHALTHVLPFHKEKILARDGKLVIRPDSGDPVDILTGKNSRTLKSIHSGTKTDPEDKGVVELLWETFGGTVNDKGFKELDSHIGVIYGDSINYERAQQIIARLAAKGFASTNVVFGVGSFTYQYNTRDTFMSAIKATWAEIDGKGVNLKKDPATDSGTKKSATGRLAVLREENGDLFLAQEAPPILEDMSVIQPIWENGEFLTRQTFAEVRNVLNS